MSMATRVLIVDDHPAVREGLAVRIASQPDLVVCGEANDVSAAIKLIEADRPDVVVVDIQLETGNGLDLVERIKTHDESIGILVWSMYPDSLYAQRALHAGALGYINKRHATGRIVEAIRRVREGEVYVCHEIAEKLLGQVVGGGKHLVTSGVESLSDRELEVFRLIGQGLSTSQIADRLHRSVHTVEAHRQKIKAKLNLSSAGELNCAAARWTVENG
jgi:DNA-binding NarL/FixJ family response regulator